VTVSAGTLVVTQNWRKNSSLTVADGATAVLTPRSSPVKVLEVKDLNLNTTGTLDLNDNDIVVGYGTNPSPFTTVRGYVFQGYSPTPDPSKNGIISSTGQTVGNTIVAVIDNALIGASDWPLGSGNTIATNSVIGKYTYFGDMDFDGQVTPGDYGILDANLNTTPPLEIAWLSGDADLDGSVTPGDYGILDANLGSGTASPLAPSAVSVPEPASAVGLGLAFACWGWRRRKRRT